MTLKKIIFLLIFIFSSLGIFAQNQIFIIHSDSLKGNNEFKELMGRVSLQQGTTILHCKQAIFNSLTNNVLAYGNVKIIQADTVTITGDTAVYNGDMRQAFVSGKVKLDDHTIALNTPKLNYDLNSRFATYDAGEIS